MTAYPSRFQQHALKSSAPLLGAPFQSRSWGDSLFDQPQHLVHDFSHVDLFSHHPGQRPTPYALQAKLVNPSLHEQATDLGETGIETRIQRALTVGGKKINDIDKELELDKKIEENQHKDTKGLEDDNLTQKQEENIRKGGEIYTYLKQIATDEIPNEEAEKLKINQFDSWDAAWSTIENKISEEAKLAELLLKKDFSKENDQPTVVKEIAQHPQSRLKKILHFSNQNESGTNYQATQLKPEFLEELAKVSKEIKLCLDQIKEEQNEIPGMDEDAFKKFDVSTKYILKYYPKEKYTYVGLGASVMPITAMLEEAGLQVYDIPLSTVRAYGENKEALDDKESFQRLSAYLDTCLSGINLEKPILIYDYSSGRSLYVTEYILEKYFREKYKKDLKIIPLSIGADTGKWAGKPFVESTNITGMKEMDQKLAEEIGTFLEKIGTKQNLYRTTAKIALSEVLSGTEKILHVIDAMPRVKRHIQAFREKN
ncbi:MAG: hypothetical protein KME16_15345 [Scytolyngbya sp. HA4215-MV1]|jgi:hypothetical protein|nr:hypothetical protein [Scytolyngbya sp. HA4215-MV1]